MEIVEKKPSGVVVDFISWLSYTLPDFNFNDFLDGVVGASGE